MRQGRARFDRHLQGAPRTPRIREGLRRALRRCRAKSPKTHGVPPALVTGTFGAVVDTPFEITGRDWSDAVLQDVDGDGFRDYVTFQGGAMWFKLNAGKTAGSAMASGRFEVVQRVPLSKAETNRILTSFDAAHLRTDTPRSAVMVVEASPGNFVLRERASRLVQD